MSDDETLTKLEAALEKQREDDERRHQALLDKLTERNGGAKQMSQADASRTMANGYAQTAAEREARKAAARGGDGDDGDAARDGDGDAEGDEQ
jgi:hypothetical protein